MRLRVKCRVGFDLVPVTVFRDGPFGPGAVQEWIDVPEGCDVISLAQEIREDIRRMALLMQSSITQIENLDTFSLMSQENVYGCDHGVAFHEEDKLRTVLWQFAGEQLNSVEAGFSAKSRRGLVRNLQMFSKPTYRGGGFSLNFPSETVAE